MGALAIEPVSLVNLNLRDGEGMIIAPLEYGQHEVHLKITRDSDLSPHAAHSGADRNEHADAP